MDLLLKVEEAIRKEQLLEPGARVAVACSGGADSVALLHLLAELKDRLGLRLLVCHLNHRLRGAEADADQAFVRQLAERLELEFLVRREDVAGRAKRDRLNLEEAGRRARLEFFAWLIADGKADAVALAHTLDDQAETVLARLLRGAGTKGLAGIFPVVEPFPPQSGRGAQHPQGRLVRPLLGIRRAELREYLARCEQPWREDATNLDRRRLRNRLRLEVLPRLSPTAIEHLARLAAHAREEESFWAAYVEEKFAQLAHFTEGGWLELDIRGLLSPDALLARLSARRAREARRAVARRLLRRALAEVRGELRRITQTHVEGILRLAEHGQSGQRVSLPGAEVERRFDRLLFHPAAARPQLPSDFRLQVDAPGGVRLPGGGSLSFQVIPVGEPKKRYNECSRLVDAGRAPFPLVVRNWQPGDAYQPLGSGRVKKLKELFQERRVPRQERARTPVVLREEEIICVPRFGVAAAFGLTPASRAALLIEEKA